MIKAKVLQLIGGFTSGGAETIVVNLTNRLIDNNWEVIISARKDGPLTEQLIAKDIVHFIDKHKTFDYKYILNLVSLIKKHKIDLIHSHLFGNNLYGCLAAKYAGVKIIQTIHGMDSIKSRKRIIAYNLMASFVDKVVTVSESLEKEMLRSVPLMRNKIITIKNGIDIEKVIVPGGIILTKNDLGVAESYPIIGAVGNIKPAKGYDNLIKCAVQIVRHYPSAKFVIAGDFSENREYKEELDKLIGKLGLKKHISFIGYRKDASKILSLFDIFVISSRSEGLSMALLEAMASGKPIVATSVGGNVHILKHEENALLAKPEDPNSLSSNILRLLSNKSFSAYLGKNALKTVSLNYSIERMVKDYENLYMSIFVRTH